jgi:hypothetical protein
MTDVFTYCKAQTREIFFKQHFCRPREVPGADLEANFAIQDAHVGMIAWRVRNRGMSYVLTMIFLQTILLEFEILY